MVAFMDTTATIPTGAMAERWKWKAFVGWGLFCGAIYYPIFGALDVGRRLARQLGNSAHLGFGYVDFAGSGVVHAMGGVAGLAGALVLGPRIGKFGAGRQAAHAGGAQHPDGDARDVHPVVRMVRIQRGIDVRSNGHPLRGRCCQHRTRGGLRRYGGDVLLHEQQRIGKSPTRA